LRIVRRAGVCVLVLTVAILAVGFGYDRYASSRVVASYPPPGEILSVDGIETHTICRGTGDETLVLFHGFAGGAIDMLPLMEMLKNRIRVCSFDRPGNDYSSPMPENWTIEDALAWHDQVISELGASAPFVAGHSLGGAYALAYAAKYPTRGVILLDGLTPEIADIVVRRLGSYRGLTLVARMGLLRPLAGTFVSSDYADYDSNLAAQMKALRSRSQTIVGFAQEGSLAADGLTTLALTNAVSRLEVPILLFASGQNDVPEGRAFYESLRALHATYAWSDLMTLPDAGHYAMVTHAEIVAEHMINWISAN
jgi:pimeloyl-ACP methyl ester carboxylesterase